MTRTTFFALVITSCPVLCIAASVFAQDRPTPTDRPELANHKTDEGKLRGRWQVPGDDRNGRKPETHGGWGHVE